MRKLLLSITLFFGIECILYAQNCSVNAGIHTTICLKDSMVLNGARSGLLGSGSVSVWSQISGAPVVISSPNALVTKVTGFIAGNYTFRLRLKCKDGFYAEDSVGVTVLPLTIANAGRDTTICPTIPAALNGNSVQNGESGLWTMVSPNNAGLTISAPANPVSPIVLNPNLSGMTTLRWTITNVNGCISYDEINITNCGGVPLIDAGADQVLGNCFSNVTCTNLTASNGGVGLGGQKGIWSFVSGPVVPSIIPVMSPTTKVCNLIPGTYVFRYTVSGPCANGFDEVSVTVPPPTMEITPANANTFNASTRYCGIVNSFSINGNVPLYTGETVLWTQTSGLPVTIDNPTSPSTTVRGVSGFGTYCFNYSIINSTTRCTSNSSVCYTFYNGGSVDGGADQILPCDVTAATIPTSTTGIGTLNYKIISGPSGVFSSYPVNYRTSNIITGLTSPGTYRVEINYVFGIGCSPVSDFVDIIVSRMPTGANAGTDQNFACVSATTQLAGSNPALTGLGSGRWSQISGPNTSVLVTPANYICNVRGTIPGTYTYRWSINGGNKCPDSFDDMQVIIPDTSITNASAGTDIAICPNSTYTLQGSIYRADETVQWTSIPGGITFYPNNTIATPTISGMAANTSYQFIYTVTNSCGSFSKDTVHIMTSASAGPSIADAGNNQCLPSGTSVINLNAALPVSGSGNWTQLSGPSASITSPDLYNTTVTGTSDGSYKFIWKVSAPGCLNFTADTVLITIAGNTTIANAGTDITACATEVPLNANTPLVGTGNWTQISGDGNALISNIFNPSATVSNLSTGLYTFRWTISNGVCASGFDDVKLIISSPPSVAVAGDDQSLCGATAATTTLHAVAPLVGSGQWVQVSGPNASRISDNLSASTVVSNLTNGTYRFRWIVAGGPTCPQSTDDVLINVSLPANAGNDQGFCNLSSATLTGNTGSSGIWSQISGPSVTITQPPAGSPNATISGMTPNSVYTFRYTIPSVFGCPSTYDEVVINNGSFTLVPDAGPDTAYCNATAFILNGSQPGQGETGVWSVLSGPAGATFFPSASSVHATLRGAVPGTYIIKWTIANATCSSSDQKRIENHAAPSVANAGANQVVCFGKATLTGNIPLNGTGTWSQASGPNTATIASANNPTTAVIGLNTVGVYKFVWTISNGTVCTPGRDTVELAVTAVSPTLASAGSDILVCGQSTVQLNGNIPLTGNGNWTEIGSGSAAVIVSPGTATTVVNNLNTGTHQFVWKITNADNSCHSADTMNVVNGIAPNTANAGADDTFCVSGIIVLNANNAATGTTGAWSFVSGPDTPDLLSPGNSSCQVTDVAVGTYKFKWTISSSSCVSSSDEITIMVINDADAAAAGANQTLCAESINLYGNVPTGTNSGIWYQLAGPNNATFITAEQANSVVTNLIPGTYTFVWKIFNERCYTTDTVTYIIKEPAMVNAGNDKTICNNGSSTLLSSAIISGPDNKGTWSVISGGGTLSTTAPTNKPDTVVYIPSPDYQGEVIVRLSVQDFCHVVTDDVIILVQQPFVPVHAADDTAAANPNTLTIINVLTNDWVYTDDTLSFCQQNAVVIQPAHGTAIVNTDGTITYTPQNNFSGTDSFQYQICTQEAADSSWTNNCYKEGADSAWVYITVNANDCFIPNAFSPNGDGINDVFMIECGTNRKFNIFNNWGIELYSTEDYQNDWNGTYNGAPLPDGTYFYSLKYNSESNKTVSKAGFICLHR